MNYEQAIEKLAKAGQEHVMKYYDELTKEQKELLLAQIDATDFSVLSYLKHGRESAVNGKITRWHPCSCLRSRKKKENSGRQGLMRSGKGKSAQ